MTQWGRAEEDSVVLSVRAFLSEATEKDYTVDSWMGKNTVSEMHSERTGFNFVFILI